LRDGKEALARFKVDGTGEGGKAGVRDVTAGPGGAAAAPGSRAAGAGVRATAATVMMSGEDSDGILLARYARGDGAAARLLADRHLGRVLALARRMLGDAAEAEDVAQETMLRLWRIAGRWREGEAQVSTWLYRVAANLCTDRLRRRRRTVDIDEAPEMADPAPFGVDRMIAADRLAMLDGALGRLPERQRLAVVLRHIEGMANPEIAAVMEISVEAVESLTARGKRTLAALLREAADAGSAMEAGDGQ
jgi:RNA polymerase sigma-70 factor (ECF subfamily)